MSLLPYCEAERFLIVIKRSVVYDFGKKRRLGADTPDCSET
jgi:hypothetical protein